MGWIQKLRKNDRGANLVEFAVVAPVLLLLLFGVVEFARLVHGYTTVWSSAREGARYATTVGDTNSDDRPNYLDCDEITSTAVAKVFGTNLTQGDVAVRYYDESGVEVADCDTNKPYPLDPGGADIDSGYTIEVEATASFDAIVPLLSVFLDGIELDSTQTRSIFKGVVGD